MALTQKTGVVVLVRLILVFQDLLANVLSALVKVFVHAFRPGDWAFLFAVKILPERGDRVWPQQSFLAFTHVLPLYSRDPVLIPGPPSMATNGLGCYLNE